MADDIDLVIDQGETITVSVEDAGPDADVIVTLGTGGGGGVTSISDVVGLQAALDGKASTTDARFTDSREWIADTVSQAEAEAGTATTRRAWTALRVFQAIAAWWAASSAKSKLDGIATGATANATDAQLRDRSTHTGTQLRATISDFAHAATHGFAGSDPITVDQAQVEGLSEALSDKASTSHASTHAADGSDPITLSQSQVTSTLGTANLQGDITQLSTIVSTLGTAATYDVPDVGSNAGTSQVVVGSDTRLTNARAPTSHSHGNITNAGAIGSTANLPVITTTSGVLTTGTFGTTANSFAQGNDARLVADGNKGDITVGSGNTSWTINAGAVVTADLADSAVTTAKIASAAVTVAKVSATGTASSSTFLRGDGAWAAAPVTSVDGSTGDVVVTKAAIYDFLRGSAPSGATGNGDGWTWSLPSWAKWIQIYAVGGGSGGASGRRGASGSLAGGGGGGCGGFVSQTFAIVSDLGASTLWIAVGAGGAGGAAQTANDTNGNGGTAGGQCYIRVSSSSGAVILAQDLFAFNSNAGTSSGGGGVTGSNGSWNVGNGAQSAAGGDGTTAVVSPSLATNQLAGPSGGGGGGGISSGNSAQAGGSTNWPYRGRFSDGQPVGASGGAVGAAGSNGGTSAYAFCGRVGIGGGGGGSSTTAAGGNGGNGGFPGGAGGGGGASRNGFNSGAGGNGGDGLVRIIVWG